MDTNKEYANGINPLQSTILSVSFNTRTKASIDDIIAFFTARGGVTAFNWTIPDTNGTENSNTETTIKVICSNWSQTYDYDNFYSPPVQLLEGFMSHERI